MRGYRIIWCYTNDVNKESDSICLCKYEVESVCVSVCAWCLYDYEKRSVYDCLSRYHLAPQHVPLDVFLVALQSQREGESPPYPLLLISFASLNIFCNLILHSKIRINLGQKRELRN